MNFIYSVAVLFHSAYYPKLPINSTFECSIGYIENLHFPLPMKILIFGQLKKQDNLYVQMFFI